MVSTKHMAKMINEMAGIAVLAREIKDLFKKINTQAILKYGEKRVKYGEEDPNIHDALSRIYTHVNKILVYSASEKALVQTIAREVMGIEQKDKFDTAFNKLKSIIILVRDSGKDIFDGAKDLKKAMPDIAGSEIDEIKTISRKIIALARMERKEGKKTFRRIVQEELTPAFA